MLGALGHIALALVMQQLVDRICRSRVAGAAAAIAWAIAREITQAEYRWIKAYAQGQRANMPWWRGFDLRVWNHLDPWLDWLLPTGAVCLVLVWSARKSTR
jgi:hypothetical protein